MFKKVVKKAQTQQVDKKYWRLSRNIIYRTMKETDWWHYQMTWDTKGTWGAQSWRQLLV